MEPLKSVKILEIFSLYKLREKVWMSEINKKKESQSEEDFCVYFMIFMFLYLILCVYKHQRSANSYTFQPRRFFSVNRLLEFFDFLDSISFETPPEEDRRHSFTISLLSRAVQIAFSSSFVVIIKKQWRWWWVWDKIFWGKGKIYCLTEMSCLRCVSVIGEGQVDGKTH